MNRPPAYRCYASDLLASEWYFTLPPDARGLYHSFALLYAEPTGISERDARQGSIDRRSAQNWFLDAATYALDGDDRSARLAALRGIRALGRASPLVDGSEGVEKP